MNIKNLGGAPSLAARAFRTPPPPQNLSNRRRATQLRRTAAAIAAALLFTAGQAAFAQIMVGDTTHETITINWTNPHGGSGQALGAIGPKMGNNCPTFPMTFSNGQMNWQNGWRALIDSNVIVGNRNNIVIRNAESGRDGSTTALSTSTPVPLSPATTYCLGFIATSGATTAGRMELSAEATTLNTPMAPARPAAVTFGAVTATSVVVNWVAPANNGAAITGYTLTRTPAFASAVTVTGTSYTDMNLDPGTQYSYQVAATNSVGTGTPSPAATVTPSSGEQVNDAVLPEVLRGTTRGIHNSIFNRILQRQREDGKWK